MNINFSPPKNTKASRLIFSQRELVIAFCVMVAVFVSWLYPIKSIGESFFVSFALFFIFPLVIVKFLLKEPLSNFGLSWGDKRKGIAYASGVTAIFLLLNFLLVSQPALRGKLLIAPDIARNFWYFLLFALIVSPALHFFWEFFFRGFMQMGLQEKFGAYAIIPLQAILQSAPHFKSSWLIMLLIFFAAVASGIVTRQSRSIFYSFLSACRNTAE